MYFDEQFLDEHRALIALYKNKKDIDPDLKTGMLVFITTEKTLYIVAARKKYHRILSVAEDNSLIFWTNKNSGHLDQTVPLFKQGLDADKDLEEVADGTLYLAYDVKKLYRKSDNEWINIIAGTKDSSEEDSEVINTIEPVIITETFQTDKDKTEYILNEYKYRPNKHQIKVYLNGRLVPEIAYEQIADDRIKFIKAPPEDHTLIIDYYIKQNYVAVNREEFDLNEGERSITLEKGTYKPHEHKLKIYINGLIIPESAYHETDETHITFVEAPGEASVIVEYFN